MRILRDEKGENPVLVGDDEQYEDLLREYDGSQAAVYEYLSGKRMGRPAEELEEPQRPPTLRVAP